VKLIPGLLLTLGGVFVLSKITAAGAASRLNFIIANVGFSQTGITSVLNLVINVQNPTNTPFTISSLAGNVLLNGNLIGNIAGFNQTIVAANSQTPLGVTVSLSTIATLNDLYSVFSAGHAIVTVQGTANVDNIPLPINLTYTVV
jgi:LEA14-like dessication related protein